MMKNRAGWVALLVLAIATLLMIFVVMPSLKKGDGPKDALDKLAKGAGEVVETAKEAAGTLTDKAGRTLQESGDSLQKMERLKSEADAAAAALQALFADGRIPSQEEIAEAKAKAEAALQALADVEVPEGAGGTLGNVAGEMREKAAKALDLVKSMPEDASGAADALASLGKILGVQSSIEAAGEPGSESGSDAAQASGGSEPAFDILRVEKDGSTVIAGRALSGAKVSIVDGDTVIASSVAGPEGDFAVVLDQPLGAGEHELKIRTMGEGGEMADSPEVATVVVPGEAGGEVLAMVTKPGEASRIMTMPEAKAGEAAVEVAEADAATKSVGAEDTASQAASTDSGEQADGSADATAGNAVAGGQSIVPDLPTASGALVGAAPNFASPAASQASADATGADTPAGNEAGEAQVTAVSSAEVHVSAVELEGAKMFVAGSAKPGTLVRIYADDKLLGEETAGSEGRFLVEGELALEVGSHIIRADAVDAASGKVIVRASVPFERPEGESVAAVAGAGEAGASAAVAPASQLAQLKEEVAKAFILLKGLFADGKQPGADEVAAARSAAEISLNALAAYKPAGNAPDMAEAAKAAESAATALKVLKETPSDAAALASAIPALETAASDASASSLSGTDVAVQSSEAEAGQVAAEAAGASTAEAGTMDVAGVAEGTEAAEPKTVEQTPLQQSKSSVIIRQGDTLWQISRRIYGKGIRYTTIYLANQDDIVNPNQINPGQIFEVPEEMLQSDTEAEQTNRQYAK